MISETLIQNLGSDEAQRLLMEQNINIAELMRAKIASELNQEDKYNPLYYAENVHNRS